MSCNVLGDTSNIETTLSCRRIASSVLNEAVEETAKMDVDPPLSFRGSRRRLTNDEIYRIKNQEITLHQIFPSSMIDIGVMNCLLSKQVPIPVEFLGISTEKWNNLKIWIKDLKNIFYGSCLFSLWRETRQNMHFFQQEKFEFNVFRQWLSLYDKDLYNLLVSKEKISSWRERFADFMKDCDIQASNVWVFGEIGLLISGKQLGIPENDVLMYRHFKENFNIPVIGKPHIHTFLSVSAFGVATKPCVIYPRDALFPNLTAALKSTSYVVENAHGDVSMDIVVSWFKDAFLPVSRSCAVNPTLLLINENFSGLGLLTWEFCKDNNCKVFCYPRSCDSPFNKGIFDLFTKHWKDTQKLYATMASENNPTQRSFLFIYKQSLRNALHVRKITEVLSDYTGLSLDVSNAEIDGLTTANQQLNGVNVCVSANQDETVPVKRSAESVITSTGPPCKITRFSHRIAIFESFLKKEIPVKIAELKTGLNMNFIRRCKLLKKHPHLNAIAVEKLVAMFNDAKTYEWAEHLALRGCGCIAYIFLYDLCTIYGVRGIRKSFYRDFIAKNQFWTEFLELYPQSSATFDEEGNVKNPMDPNVIYAQVINQYKYESLDQIWFVDAFEFPITNDDRAVGLPTKNSVRPRHNCKKVSVIFAFSFSGQVFKPLYVFPNLFDPIEVDENNGHFMTLNGFFDPMMFRHFLLKFNIYCTNEKLSNNRLILISSKLPVINIECLNLCKATNIQLVFTSANQPSPFERLFSCANRGRSSDLFIESWKKLMNNELKSHLIREFSRSRFTNLFESAIKETFAELGDIKKKAASAFMDSSLWLHNCASRTSSETVDYVTMSAEEGNGNESINVEKAVNCDRLSSSVLRRKSESRLKSRERSKSHKLKKHVAHSSNEDKMNKFLAQQHHHDMNRKDGSPKLKEDGAQFGKVKQCMFRKIADDFRILENRRRSIRIKNAVKNKRKSLLVPIPTTPEVVKKSDRRQSARFVSSTNRKTKDNDDIKSLSNADFYIDKYSQTEVEQSAAEVQASFDYPTRPPQSSDFSSPPRALDPGAGTYSSGVLTKSVVMDLPDDTTISFGIDSVMLKTLKVAFASAESFAEAALNLLKILFSEGEQSVGNCHGNNGCVALDPKKLQWIRSVILKECRFRKDHNTIWAECEKAIDDFLAKKYQRNSSNDFDDKTSNSDNDKPSSTSNNDTIDEMENTNEFDTYYSGRTDSSNISSEGNFDPVASVSNADDNAKGAVNISKMLEPEVNNSLIEKQMKFVDTTSNKLISVFPLIVEPPHPLPDMSVPIVSVSDANQPLNFVPETLIASIPFAAANFAAHIFNANECSSLDPASDAQSLDLLKLDKTKLKLVKDSILAKCSQSVNTEMLWTACCNEIHKRLTETYIKGKISVVEKTEKDDDDVIWIGGGRSDLEPFMHEQSVNTNALNANNVLETDYLQQIIFGNQRQREIDNFTMLAGLPSPTPRNTNMYMSLTRTNLSRPQYTKHSTHRSVHSLLSIKSPRFSINSASPVTKNQGQQSNNSVACTPIHVCGKSNLGKGKTINSLPVQSKPARMYCFDGLEITEAQAHSLAQRSPNVQQFALYLFTVIFKAEELPPVPSDYARKLDPLKIEWIRRQCKLQDSTWEACLNCVFESRSKWYEIRSLAISLIEDLPSSDVITAIHKRSPDYISFILSLVDIVFYQDWHVHHYVGSSLRRLAYMKSSLFSCYRIENQSDAWKNCTKAVCNWAIHSNRFIPPLDQEIQQFFKGNQNLQEVTILLAQFITSPPRFTSVLDTLKTEWIKSFIMCSASSNVDRHVVWKSCEAILKKHCIDVKNACAPISHVIAADSREVILLHSSQA